MNNLKFLLDVNVGQAIEEVFTEKKYDIKCVNKLDPTISDIEILKIALSEKRIIVTLDKDFGELIFNSGHPHAGVLFLRIEDATILERKKIITYILDNFYSQLQNNFCIYKKGNFRIRS